MAISERRKGLRGQQEVQRILRDSGLTIRTLGATGDALVLAAPTATLHIETKRQERLQLKQWLAQAEAEAPRGAVPVVCFRPSAVRVPPPNARPADWTDTRSRLERGEWYACLPLADLVRIVA